MNTPFIFVGGPGRSGTSFTADRIGAHPEIASFKDVELKLFGELGGLSDLQHSLTDRFTPNRCELATKEFVRVFDAVCSGRYGQVALRDIVSQASLAYLKEEFLNKICPNGHITRLSRPVFNAAMREFSEGLALLAFDGKQGASHFLEKTPHNLLQPQFLHELSCSACYIHVYRDPKGIAASLLNQSWGPSTLASAVSWVKSYFDAWSLASEYYASFNLPLLELKIEEIATDPAQASGKVCEHLGISIKSDMFLGANLASLSKWKNKAGEHELEFLSRELGSLCEDLGY